ncbi:helix-turn-helix domain-containing protein [Lactococcus lactis subsp. lactis]|uniref:Helix-turn-helix protein n=2 Tax=Bacillati TaxID=1783272 RepID=A0A2N5WEI7_LACLL|nr:helix-turn-helix transcriptional regulator [Lactococcus lactis]MBU5242992.1 helix-turn-helix domain-containing protein [Lactococcus lactis]MDT2857882.1 helix-turn-helix transcriptional regulator [Lactococcus lactis]MQQ79446.1 helix-turn-helix domain-containing protein [Lactococcus lactis]PLW60617.1 helix-turn-helix protein [Lactococcus lactis subsp. lactis]
MESETLFYNRLNKLVKQSGKSYNQIERELDYPRNALANYKFGKTPSGTRLIELAEYFSVSPEYLIGNIENFNIKIVEGIFREFNFEQKVEMSNICRQWLQTSNKKRIF